VTITVGGDLGRNDAAVLSRQLHTALETAPSVVVVNVCAVTGADPCAQEVLAVARDRARAANIALHVVDPHHHLTDDH
jgi:anti-anti-sigma regulatory factor